MTLKCEKCKQFVPEDQARVFNLTLRPDNLRRTSQNKIDKIVLCNNCDSKRRTTITRYVSL